MQSTPVPTEIERIVAAAFDAEVGACRRPTHGSVAETYVLDLDSSTADGPRRVVCKRGNASVWTGDVIEPLVVERVAKTSDVPVPSVLATGSIVGGDSERTELGPLDRWACYEFRMGTNPGPHYLDLEPAVRRRLVTDAGDYLGRLHGRPALAFDRVGGLARTEHGISLRVRDPDGWHAVGPGPLRSRVPVPVAGDPDCRPALTHGDYQPGNLLVDADGAVTAVLDWGNAHVTHAGYALARAEATFVDVHRLARTERSRLRRRFRSAYAQHAPIEPEFAERAPIYKALWIAQSIANYGRIARTARGRTQLWRQIRSYVDRNTA